MKKFVLALTLGFLIFISSLHAQVTPPCGTPPPPGAESCLTTCVYCNFDGYMGINNGTPSGGNTVCGQISIHNDQWFGFVAGSTDISIDILQSNCQVGDGLQAAFFDACSEDAITCNPGCANCGNQPMNLTYSGFVPGQTYYLMIDGYIGDVCNYEIDVVSGSVTPPPPTQPGPISGPTAVCPGAVVVYSVPDADGAGYYTWTAPNGASINGGANTATIAAPEGNTITVTFGSAGGTICVKSGNACFPATPNTCINVTNQPVPPTILDDVIICSNQLPYQWDQPPFNVLGSAGTYNLSSSPFDNYLGCDSTVKQKIIVKPPLTTNLGNIFICEGECFEIGTQQYCNTTGSAVNETLPSFQGCDSIVTFNVIKIPADAEITANPAMITCTNPVVTLQNTGTTIGSSLMVTWSNTTWNFIGSGNQTNVNAGGTYHLVVKNTLSTKSCADTTEIVIMENKIPPGATATGGTIGCSLATQTVTLTGVSPTPGVTYLWTGPGINASNQGLANPTVSTPGTYNLVVTNPTNGCTSTATAIVDANNTPPTVSAAGGTLNCTQLSVTINGTTNVTAPNWVWAGPGINASNINMEDPIVTVGGTYTVTVTNGTNGCSNTASAVVVLDTELPVGNAGSDQVITCAVLNVSLSGSGSAGGDPVTYNWSGPGINAGNQNLQNPTVNLVGTYIVSVTNSTNSCLDTDTVIVTSNALLPIASAGPDPTITCAAPTVVLNGSGSNQGGTYSVVWSGPGITPANQNQINPTVSVSGLYTITISNSANGCTSTDQVLVDINTSAPTSNAGTDQILTCTSTNGVTLAGSGTPGTVTYLWSGPGIGANNATVSNPQVTQAGIYTLTTTNPANGCTASDQVEVTQDASVPTASAGTDPVINCLVSSVNLDASASTTGGNITYAWSGPGINATNQSDQSPQNITAPGIYTITVTNTTSNCINTDIVVVLLDTIHPNADAGPQQILNCYNLGQDTLDASLSNLGAIYSINWGGPGINPGNVNLTNPIVMIGGMYSVTITNTVNGCVSTDQTTVLDNQINPTADAGADQAVDCVTTSLQIGGASSGGPNFTYLWQGPSITPAIQNLANPIVAQAGSYIITVTNTSNGCTATDNMNLASNAIYPVSNAGPDGLITCANPDYLLDGSASSSGANFNYSWDGPGINAGNQSQPTPTVNLPGMYILTMTDQSNFCQETDTVEVLENVLLPNANAGGDLILDCQTTDVDLDGSLSSTGTDFTYFWTGPGINAGNQNLQNPNIVQPGNYTLEVTNSVNGCKKTDVVVVTQNITLPIANAGSDITLTCLQNTLAIDGSGSSAGANFGYLWSGPGITPAIANQMSPMVSDSGTYTIQVTNNINHCTSTDVVYVALDGDFPISDAGNPVVLTCANDTIQLDGSGSQSGASISYAWTGPGIVLGQNNILNPQVFEPGTYTLVVSNAANGCSKSDFVVVDFNFTAPTVDAGIDATLTCANTSGINLNSAGSSNGPDFTYLWSGPGIDITNQNQANPLITVAGVYTLEITDELNGCTATDLVVISQDQGLPTTNAGNDITIDCINTVAVLDGTGSSQGNEMVYLWTGPGINASNQNQQSPQVTVAGTYTLEVTNTLTACKSTDNVIVTIDNTAPTIALSTDTITCQHQTGQLLVNSSDPTSTFHWTGPGITGSNQSLPNPMVTEQGNYSVTVTGANGCSSSQSIQMFQDADFPSGTAIGAVLNCSNNGESSISGTVNTFNSSWIWDGPGTFTSTELEPLVTQAGTYSFIITNANGCSKTFTTEVSEDFEPPIVTATVSDMLDCNTTSLVINALGSSFGSLFTLDWTTVGGNFVANQNTLTPEVDAPGTYTLAITDLENGCPNEITVTVEQDPAVPTGFILDLTPVTCYGDKDGAIAVDSVIGGTIPFLYSFNGNPSTSTASFGSLPSGSYDLSLEDANGCILDSTVVVGAPNELLVELGDDIEIQLGDSVDIAAQISNPGPYASVIWNPVAPCDSLCYEFNIKPLFTQILEITVVDSTGCISRDEVLIKVKKDRFIYIPNVIYPGSQDPINSVLMVQGGKGVTKIKSFQIYDRWGEAIFEAFNFQPNDPSYAWDGTAKGKLAASAVFIWTCEVEFLDGVVELYTGDVTLVKN